MDPEDAARAAEALWGALQPEQARVGAPPITRPLSPRAHLERAIEIALREADGPDDPLGPVILSSAIANEGFPEPVDLGWLSRVWREVVKKFNPWTKAVRPGHGSMEAGEVITGLSRY